MQTLPSDSGSGLVLAPFRGIRYARDRVSGIANVTSPPYDVINGSILDHLRASDPHNVVRLILPGEDADASQAAAALLRAWLSAGVLIRDRMAALYIYEQSLQPQDGAETSWLQRGIVGLVGLGSPETAGILPHEGVMPGLVAGRRELMAATQANLEPIFLIYDGDQATGAAETATAIMDRVAAERAPLVSITTEDGTTHRLWRLGEPAEQAAIAADLAGRRALIADGHHRYAAYLDLQAEMRRDGLGDGPWDYGLAFLVDSAAYPPRLGAIHRVLPGLPPDRAAELAKAAFTVQDLPAGLGLDDALRRLAAAGREGTAFLLAGGPVFRLLSQPDPVQLAASMPAGMSASWQQLDASVMQHLLLGRLWGVTDSERDVLIDHDAADAVRAVAGDAAATDVAERGGAGPVPAAGGTAVISNPASFEAVIRIAACGERVPRKSTSFGPKPRTGLVLRTFGPAD
ncbi:MAG TPA: DUF1015 domain-containing protein [Streptosporangiaceae bacterium]|nr:DUF1015 domain-containing protein [Streptosporangiaceae bacterium]